MEEKNIFALLEKIDEKIDNSKRETMAAIESFRKEAGDAIEKVDKKIDNQSIKVQEERETNLQQTNDISENKKNINGIGQKVDTTDRELDLIKIQIDRINFQLKFARWFAGISVLSTITILIKVFIK